MDLKFALEAILFREGKEMTFKELSRLLNLETRTISKALTELQADYANRGVAVVLSDDSVVFATSSKYAPILEKIFSDERKTDLSPASLDTLSIIIYCSPISKADIDYVRGVNSSAILRTLTIRDLVDRNVDRQSKQVLYKPSINLMRHLGVTDLGQLPDYKQTRTEILAFLEQKA